MLFSTEIDDAESVLGLSCNFWQRRSRVAAATLSHVVGDHGRFASYLLRPVVVQASDRYSCLSIQYRGD